MSIFCRHDWEYRVEFTTTEANIGDPATAWRKCRKCDAHKFYYYDKPTLLTKRPTNAEIIEQLKNQKQAPKKVTQLTVVK